MLTRLVQGLRRRLGALHPQSIRFRRELARRDSHFDAEHGVDTGASHLKTLTIDSANRRHGFPHIAIVPQEFFRAMQALPIRHPDFTFVDLGSGKGRALMLALDLPFRRRIGVEFARELHEVATANLRGKAVELVCMDATLYDFPAEPLVVFLYNPFGAEIVTRVAQRLRAHPATLYVVYINPFFVEPWTSHGFQIVAQGSPYAIFGRGATLPAAGRAAD